jgi:hypothetical protein
MAGEHRGNDRDHFVFAHRGGLLDGVRLFMVLFQPDVQKGNSVQEKKGRQKQQPKRREVSAARLLQLRNL